MFVKPAVYGIIILLLFSSSVNAQTLFSYGSNKVSKEEFIKAYKKNNPDSAQVKMSLNDYLELYYRYKLKVKAALDAKMDTLENQRTEFQGFRNQLAEYHVKDDAGIQVMIDEAFERSLKDIRLFDIFIPLAKNASDEDEKAASIVINQAYKELKQGSAFETVALKYNSQDAGVNNGDMGFISVFTLPYDLETLAYSTLPGKFSAPFRGKTGFHILMNKEERKAAGKIRIAQILLAFQPGIQDNEKMIKAQRADSIYKALESGADFALLAEKFSEDNLTYKAGGEMPAFEPGHYDPLFETAAFGLLKDGDISKPVKTAFGYHIIKRIQRIPVVENKSGGEWREVLKERIEQGDRIQAVQERLARNIQSRVGYKKLPFNEKELAILTDSIAKHRSLPSFPDLPATTPLFIIGKDAKTVTDFRNYLDEIRSTGQPIQEKATQLLNRFTEKASLDYYRDHLEDYNKDFVEQLNEFKAGNLLFEIMQHKVWDASLSDSVELEKYYTDHKDKYWWEQSADALIIACPDKKTAEDVRAALQTNRLNWRTLADSLGAGIQADSGRFDLSQIPVLERTNFTEGLITAGVKNELNNSITLSYIIKLYKERTPKSFADARGAVITDFQDHLEEKWIGELKQKYPLKINKKAFKTLKEK